MSRPAIPRGFAGKSLRRVLHTPRRLARRRARGLSLVELMVGVTLGLLITAALLTLLADISRNRTQLAVAGQVNENGRFAVNLLANHAVHAGFWGGFIPSYDDLTLADGANFAQDYPAEVVSSPSQGTDTTAVPDPCKARANWSAQYRTNLMAIPVQVYRIADPVPDPVLSVCASIVNSPLAGTDVLIMRHAETCAAGSCANCPGECVAGSCPNCPALSTGEEFFQLNNCYTVASGTISPRYVFANAIPGSNTALKRNCTSAADQHRFVSNLFYIRTFSVTAGDGIPTLMHARFGVSGGTPQFLSAQPLIPGIQGFRVEVGVDDRRTGDTTATVNRNNIEWADTTNLKTPRNRGDGVPDTWVTCPAIGCTADQLTNAVALRLHVLSRSERTSAGPNDTKTYTLAGSTLGPFNDGFRRHVFTQTVRLHNVSSRRETPP
jgi:type IV pilus assembly protein PilW